MNPNALIIPWLNDEIDINDYVDLFNFDIPQECVDRLNALSGYENQPFEEGNVAITSVDRYEILITDLPLDGNGAPKSMDEVFEDVRLNFGPITSGSMEEFAPS